MTSSTTHRVFLALMFLLLLVPPSIAAEDAEAARKLLSANQAHYNRFLKEKDALLAGRKKEQLSSQETAKLSSLENKIRVLNQEIQRAQTRPSAGKSADPTIAQWKKMSQTEKERYVYQAIGSLERREVFILKPSHFYIQQLDDISADAYFEDKFLDDVFVFNVYDQEPHTRDAIDRIRASAEKVPV